MTTPTMTLLGEFQRRGYEPQEDARPGEDWFDRRSGDRSLRVIMDDDEVKLIAFDAHQCVEWDIALSLYVPVSLVVAVLDAAEAEAADYGAHRLLRSHGPYAAHSHEVRADHLGVERR